MMSGHVTELLSAYLDGQVSGDERARITAHLEACAACRAHLESLRQTVRVLRGAEPVRAPEGFRAQVRARVEAEARRPVRRWHLPPVTWSWKTAGAVVTVVLIGLFTVNVLREQFPASLGERGAPKGGFTPPAASVDRAAPPTPGVIAPQARVAVPPAPMTPEPVLPALRRVIRTAQVSLEVDDLDDAASRLTRLAESAGGFVAGSSYVQSGTPEGSFVLRVPSPRFADVLSQVETLGHVLQRRLSGQDVTEEYVDLQARIRNLERYEQRLLAFVDRATKVSDLLAIEQELARVRGEIEMLTGRMRYLDRQVDLATIDVSVREKAKPSSSFWNVDDTLTKIRNAFLATIHQLLRAAEAMAVAISALVPVGVLAAVAWMVIRRVRSRAQA